MTRRRLTAVVVLALLVALAWALVAGRWRSQSPSEAPLLSRTYPVNKRVSDFPQAMDLSTPETACAAILRLTATGRAEGWASLSAREARSGLTGMADQQVPVEVAARYLNARIAEIRVYGGEHAVAFVELGGRYPVRARALSLEGGRWLNCGENPFDSLQQARQHYDRVGWR